MQLLKTAKTLTYFRCLEGIGSPDFAFERGEYVACEGKVVPIIKMYRDKLGDEYFELLDGPPAPGTPVRIIKESDHASFERKPRVEPAKEVPAGVAAVCKFLDCEPAEFGILRGDMAKFPEPLLKFHPGNPDKFEPPRGENVWLMSDVSMWLDRIGPIIARAMRAQHD